MRTVIITMTLGLAVLLVMAAAVPARAFDVAELAQRYAGDGSLPKQQTGPLGYTNGATNWPPGSPGGRPPAGGPRNNQNNEELMTQLVVMLVGHACNDLARGAELFSSDPSEKNANFMRYTVDKVIASLELDPADGTLAPVMRAVQARDARSIEQSVSAMQQEVSSGISSELGQRYLWYFEAGQNISRIEFAVWEETHFNLLNYFAKGVNPQINFQAPIAGGAEDFAALLAQVQTDANSDVDVATLLEDYFIVRDYIYQVYNFEGTGLVLW